MTNQEAIEKLQEAKYILCEDDYRINPMRDAFDVAIETLREDRYINGFVDGMRLMKLAKNIVDGSIDVNKCFQNFCANCGADVSGDGDD